MNDSKKKKGLALKKVATQVVLDASELTRVHGGFFLVPSQASCSQPSCQQTCKSRPCDA